MQLIKLLIFIFIGLALAFFGGIRNLEDASWYGLTVAALLAIGLYASTYGIDLKEARSHMRLIISAVTFGVVAKALIIGGSLALIFRDPFFLVLGVTMAQIDPLSVASLMNGERMSAKAKTILASWASFDDPVTVILTLYVPMLVAQTFGIELGSSVSVQDSTAGLMSYIKNFGLNLGSASLVLGLYFIIRRYSKDRTDRLAGAVQLVLFALLALAFVVSVWYFLMLGIALIGLFLRPPHIDKYIDRAITWALRLAAVLLGLLLINGINLVAGIALGIVAYFAQVVPGFWLTRKLPQKDRWHIAFAQQNGITAIILALLLETMHPGVVAIVAPAIIVVNTLHAVVNRVIDKNLHISSQA